MSSSSDSSKPLLNKIILVTGAGDGIGKSVSLAYARAGATVILLGRTQHKLEQVYDEIVAEHLSEPIIHPMDLASAGSEEYEILGKSVKEQFGHLDGLLHNAGHLGTLGPMQYIPPEVWMKIMQVNVNAGFLLTRALMPALMAAQDARVLFTSSSVGRKGRAYWGAYAVSKFAVEGMMQVLADELQSISAIKINTVNPGATRTGMRAAAYPAENPASLPTPESLTPAYVFLMSAAAANINGQAINIRELLEQLPAYT
ncbi:MAG: YciK family oxidoreductase [Pseudohongiella sp.]|nr:YciK family oxidoreductase [Pseudohongiella sp.]